MLYKIVIEFFFGVIVDMAKAKKLQKGRTSPTQGSMTGGFGLKARKRQQKPRVKRVSWSKYGNWSGGY